MARNAQTRFSRFVPNAIARLGYAHWAFTEKGFGLSAAAGGWSRTGVRMLRPEGSMEGFDRGRVGALSGGRLGLGRGGSCAP
jgi:hypothetical protein